MTTAHGTQQFGLWSIPVCPIVIEHDLTTLEGVAGEVLNGFGALRGGLEVGGLLLGACADGRLRITAFEPIACEHAFGPTFRLSPRDRQGLQQQLEGHAAHAAGVDHVVVGWYHSHTRSELAFSAEDTGVHDQFFPEPWQAALVLRPEADLSIQARFFFRAVSEVEEAVLVPYAPFSLRLDESAQPAPPRAVPSRVRRTGDAAPREEVPRGPSRVAAPVVALRSASRQVVPRPARRSGPGKLVVALLVVMLAGGLAAVFYFRLGQGAKTRPPAVLRIEAAGHNGALDVTWDAAVASSVRQARLEIRDGASRQEVGLDAAALARGRYNYRPISDITAFSLYIERPDGSMAEGSTTFVAPNVPPETQAPVVTATPAETEPPPAPLRERPEPEPNRVMAETTKAAPPARAAREPEQKPAPPVPAVSTSASRVDERAKVSPPRAAPPQQPPVSTPVQTAQTPPQQTSTVQRTVAQSPPIDHRVAPTPVGNATSPQSVTPEQRTVAQNPSIDHRVAPTPVGNATSPQNVTPPVVPPPVRSPAPQAPRMRLAGRWNLQPGGLSRSPAVPEALWIYVTEDGAGVVSGTLEARYRSRSKIERVSLSFAGRVVNGVARFPWNSSDGRTGEIEFIRIPNAPDTTEVVWYGNDMKQPFDEILKRGN